MPSGVYIRSIEYKKHFSESISGNKHWNWTGGKTIRYCEICNNEFRTYIHSEKSRFCSIKCKSIWMSKNMTNDNHWNWQGGISKEKDYYRKWLLKYRHKKGISKKYNSELGISYTKEYIRLHRKKYKYNLKQAGELSIKTIQMIYEDNIKQYGTLTCYLCLKPTKFGQDSLEHKIPLSRGGNNARDNLDIACQRCNCKKHIKTDAEYKEVISHD